MALQGIVNDATPLSGTVDSVPAGYTPGGAGGNVDQSALADMQIILRNIMTIIRAQVEDADGTPQAYSIDISGLATACDDLIAGLTGSGGEDEAEPLYTFETALNVPLPDRYGTKPIEYSVSNGNHVEIKAGDYVSGSAYIRSNFSTAATNGADISDAPEWFKIPADSEVTFKLTNVSISGVPLHEVHRNMQFGLRDMSATQYDEFIVFVKSSENIIPGAEYILNEPWEQTVTIESEVSVQGVCAQFIIVAGLSIEFNVELYVNGERWI